MKRCLSSGNVSENPSTNDSFVKFTNNKRPRKGRQRNQLSASQPPTTANEDSMSTSHSVMDSIISSVANPVNPVGSDQCCSNSTIESEVVNKCKCDVMKAEISNLNAIIAQLSVKVDFLMSYFGLKDDENTAASFSSNPTQLAPTDYSTDITASSVIQTSKLSYATVCKSKPAAQLSGQLRQAVMSAVYNDLHSKSTRANNIIISGLPKHDSRKDEDMVCDLIENEFRNLQPVIKLCRRLGKVVNNKTQNLLVTLESVEHVRIILSNAKQLRSSNNNFVRDNMFINADLTKAEATVAYEERCQGGINARCAL